jgi:hypothetical protein
MIVAIKYIQNFGLKPKENRLLAKTSRRCEFSNKMRNRWKEEVGGNVDRVGRVAQLL